MASHSVWRVQYDCAGFLVFQLFSFENVAMSNFELFEAIAAVKSNLCQLET